MAVLTLSVLSFHCDAYIQDKFNDSATSKNITFNIPGSGYAYIILPKYSNVTSATINISGFNYTYWWYQETSNAFSSVIFLDANDANDGNWDTSRARMPVHTNDGNLYFNYTKPANIGRYSRWEAKVYGSDSSIINASINSSECLAYSTLQLRIECDHPTSSSSIYDICYGYCYNSTGWMKLWDITYKHDVFEEGMHWAVDNLTSPSNITINTDSDGPVEYTLSGYINLTNSPVQADLNATTINTWILSCTFDASYNCTLPLNVTGDSAGILMLDAVNVTFDWYNELSVKSPDNDNNWSFTQLAGQSEDFNITVRRIGGSSDTSINITATGDLANASRFIFVSGNITSLAPGSTNKSLINITSLSDLAAGNYSGYINISRQQDYNFTLLQINITIGNQSGDAVITNSTFSIAVSTGQYVSRSFHLWNRGDYPLTECTMKVVTSIPISSETWDLNEFTLTNETNRTATVTLYFDYGGTDNIASVSISCKSTPSGGTDSYAITGSISVSAPSGGGGGAGGGAIPREINITPPLLPPFEEVPAGQFDIFLLVPIAGPFNLLHVLLFGGSAVIIYRMTRKQRGLKHLTASQWIFLAAVLFLLLVLFMSTGGGDALGSLGDSINSGIDSLAESVGKWVSIGS